MAPEQEPTADIDDEQIADVGEDDEFDDDEDLDDDEEDDGEVDGEEA